MKYILITVLLGMVGTMSAMQPHAPQEGPSQDDAERQFVRYQPGNRGTIYNGGTIGSITFDSGDKK